MIEDERKKLKRAKHITPAVIKRLAGLALLGSFDLKDIGASRAVEQRLIEAKLIQPFPRIGIRWTTDKGWTDSRNIRGLAGL